jgi:hypothetical protein
MTEDRLIKTGEEVVLVFSIIKREDYDKLKIPNGSYSKAIELGPVEELTNMENCKGWGAWVGISLGKLGRKLCPEIFKINNPNGPKLATPPGM